MKVIPFVFSLCLLLTFLGVSDVSAATLKERHIKALQEVREKEEAFRRAEDDMMSAQITAENAEMDLEDYNYETGIAKEEFLDIDDEDERAEAKEYWKELAEETGRQAAVTRTAQDEYARTRIEHERTKADLKMAQAELESVKKRIKKSLEGQ